MSIHLYVHNQISYINCLFLSCDIKRIINISTQYLGWFWNNSFIFNSRVIGGIVVIVINFVLTNYSTHSIVSFSSYNIPLSFFPLFSLVVKLCFLYHGLKVKWPNPCNFNFKVIFYLPIFGPLFYLPTLLGSISSSM